MSNWVPLHCHSHFSLLDGLSKPAQIADRLVECGYAAGAISDHGTIAGAFSFSKALEKKKLKPILGNEVYLCERDASVRDKTNAKRSHLVVLAKNLRGWKNLIRATSTSNRPEYFYTKPRLDLDRLASFSGGEWVTFSGHMGSDLADVCFDEPKYAYAAKTYEDARKLVAKDWESRVTATIKRYQSLFGEANFFLEIQVVDHENLPASMVVAKILRHLGKKLGVPCVATADSHYCRKEDAPDQRVLLCASMETTLNEVQRKLDNAEEVGLGAFFRSNRYHIPSLDEMRALHTDDELANSVRIADLCEAYSLSAAPMLPVYECPNGQTPDEHLRDLCRAGWEAKIAPMGLAGEKRKEYAERVKRELGVITEAGLASYFLIVQDYIRYAKEQLRCRVGLGRGSGAGCLVSYLTGITGVDPIKFGLIFERFYNAGRNQPGRVALPDIDTDFQVGLREKVIDYARRKYGDNHVCQMATFSRMQGRGAIKDVLRAHERCTYEEMNRITDHIPDEAAIADDLQEMMEETGEASIIKWALENNADGLKEWCVLKPDGSLEGPLALDFAQAIRLEGTKRSQGKHASGVVITSANLDEVAPIGFDRGSGQSLVLIDMRDAEEAGLPKFDFLGLRSLDCISDALSIMRTGRPEPRDDIARNAA